MGHNSCSFIGHLGRDPEVRTFQSGGRVCEFTIAVSESWKDRDGQRQERTEWIPVKIHGEGLIGVVERYLRKGSKVFVRGKWRTRKWTDRDGNERYMTELALQGPGSELEMLDSAGGGQRSDRQQSRDNRRETEPQSDPLDDEIPF